MKQKASLYAWTAVYFALTSLMYYLDNDSLHFGVGILFKHLFAILMIVVSVCVFLVSTDLVRGKKLICYIGVLVLPYVIDLSISALLWVFNFSSFAEIRRGLFSQVYHINVILAMAGMVYVLGSRSIWINLVSMIFVNAIRFVTVIRESGLSAYLSELRNVIVSFADDTGGIIAKMEIHELTFAFGIYLVFFIINRKELWKKPWVYVLAFLSLFFFLSGFKRISLLAVALAVAAGIALWFGASEKRKNVKWLMAAGAVAAGILLLYVGLIDWGFMSYLEEHWGINLMGRAHLLELVRDYYHFGPNYMGRGAGFLLEYMNDASGTGLHNDIVALYIDIGFWGLLLWGLSVFSVRSWLVAKLQGIHGAVLSFCYCVYLVATALTDNTFNYIYLTAVISLLTMSYRIDEPDEAEEEPSDGRNERVRTKLITKGVKP